MEWKGEGHPFNGTPYFEKYVLPMLDKNNICLWCGGEIKGLFEKRCVKCRCPKGSRPY